MSASLKLVKIPQILGAALAGNIFVLMAFEASRLSNWTFSAALGFLAIFFWNLKDFFDDMKAYEVENIEGFSLFPTVFFRILSYMTIAASIALLDSSFDVFYAMSLYFCVFIAWSTNSIVRRRKINSKSGENQERLRRRRGWLVVYSFSFLFCLAIAYSQSWLVISICFPLLMIIYVFDVIECGSFSSKINETL